MTPPDAVARVERILGILDSTLDESGDETLLHEPSGHVMYSRGDDALEYLSVGDVRWLCTDLRTVLARVEAAERDAARLDWLESVYADSGGVLLFRWGTGAPDHAVQRLHRWDPPLRAEAPASGQTLRAALDTAMQSAAPNTPPET